LQGLLSEMTQRLLSTTADNADLSEKMTEVEKKLNTGLHTVMEAKNQCVFNRLYKDAMARQAKSMTARREALNWVLDDANEGSQSPKASAASPAAQQLAPVVKPDLSARPRRRQQLLTIASFQTDEEPERPSSSFGTDSPSQRNKRLGAWKGSIVVPNDILCRSNSHERPQRICLPASPLNLRVPLAPAPESLPRSRSLRLHLSPRRRSTTWNSLGDSSGSSVPCAFASESNQRARTPRSPWDSLGDSPASSGSGIRPNTKCFPGTPQVQTARRRTVQSQDLLSSDPHVPF